MSQSHQDVEERSWIDTLSLTDERYLQIVQRLEANTKAGHPRRTNERLAFVCDAMLKMKTTAPNGTCARFKVRTFDISTTGVGVLHGRFLYPGTKCILDLHDHGGDIVELPASVVRCEHLEKIVHVVGLLFDDPIEPGDFVWK